MIWLHSESYLIRRRGRSIYLRRLIIRLLITIWPVLPRALSRTWTSKLRSMNRIWFRKHRTEDSSLNTGVDSRKTVMILRKTPCSRHLSNSVPPKTINRKRSTSAQVRRSCPLICRLKRNRKLSSMISTTTGKCSVRPSRSRGGPRTTGTCLRMSGMQLIIPISSMESIILTFWWGYSSSMKKYLYGHRPSKEGSASLSLAASESIKIIGSESEGNLGGSDLNPCPWTLSMALFSSKTKTTSTWKITSFDSRQSWSSRKSTTSTGSGQCFTRCPSGERLSFAIQVLSCQKATVRACSSQLQSTDHFFTTSCNV